MSESKDVDASGSGGDSSSDPSRESSDDKYDVQESDEEVKKPKDTRDRLKKGLTSHIGIGNAGKLKQDVDVEDMIDEGAEDDDDRRKERNKATEAKMKKLRRKKDSKDKDQNNKTIVNPTEKLDKISKGIRAFALKTKDNDAPGNKDLNQDPTVAANAKKDREKHSNANFLSKIAESESNHDDLTYGSYIILNINKEGEEHRKFTSMFRISDKIQARVYKREGYDQNCIFRIIPPAQYALQTKIRNILKEEEDIPQNVDIDYENFMSEMDANVDLQDDFMGKPVKYGSKFQLVQESSKRFLCIHESTSHSVKEIFEDRYIDSYCFYFGFSEYPSKFTHFVAKECSQFQREGSGAVKEEHYWFLCALYNNKTLYAYNVKKFMIMTQSYSTPMSYDLVRESDTFDEVEDVQSSEVVLLTYANENFYLNVPHTVNKENGEYEEKPLIFQNWQDYKDVDFNGWFMVEYDEDNKTVHLKHFNSEQYMTIINGEEVGDDYALLEEDRKPESEVVFEPVNIVQEDVNKYTPETVFKIRASSIGADMEKNYLRFANEEDKRKLSGNKKENIFEDSSNQTVSLVVRDSCPINKYDTFNLVFPTDDTYRELVFCKDTFLHIKKYLDVIEKSKDPLKSMEDINNGLFKTFSSIYRFLINDLEGRINADYDIGETVEYRQEMIAKVGILHQIFTFLEY